MNVQDSTPIKDGHSIEWGGATWDETDLSVRNRYATASGGFSPRSSSEIPLGDLEHLVVKSAERGHLSVEMMSSMASALVQALAKKASAV